MRRASTGTANLCAIFRAHQHNGDMMERILGTDNMNADNHGAAKLWTNQSHTSNRVWQNMVVTFNASPDNLIGHTYGFKYDTIGILTLADNFKDWRLNVKRLQTL